MWKKILTLLCLCFFLTASAPRQETPEAVSNVSVIYPWSEPIEVCYIIPKDGKKIIKITSGYSDRVYFVPSIPYILNNHGYEIKDIQVWIHNHLSGTSFSQRDLIVYWYLRAHGFDGMYMLKNDRGVFYYQPNEE